jgi:hypothetical protein
MFDMLKARGAGKIICPSKPARAVADCGQRAALAAAAEPETCRREGGWLLRTAS